MRLRRIAICALLAGLSLPLLGGPTPTCRRLTFADRVRAQEAIERVYYAHQVGASLPFEQAVPRAVLERKVSTYLKQSEELRQQWRLEVTSEMLLREAQRMASGTRMPERLQELHQALGNDPTLILETIARPSLVDRLVRNFYYSDSRLHQDARAEAEALHAQVVAGAPPPDTDRRKSLVELTRARRDLQSSRERPSEDAGGIHLPEAEFTQLEAELPSASGMAGALIEEADGFRFWVLVERQPDRIRGVRYRVLKKPWDAWWREVEDSIEPQEVPVAPAVQGNLSTLGLDPHSESFAPGSPQCLSDDVWDEGLRDVAPQPRTAHTAVWTGSLMIVWGGLTPLEPPVMGGRYDPATDTWSTTSTFNAPWGRFDHRAVWTGSRMIVWGGNDLTIKYRDGGQYDPLSDTWTPVSTVNSPPSGTYGTAVWTGSRMIVWGGSFQRFSASGAQYDPVADTWFPVSGVNAPSPRSLHTAVWTGTRMLVWGGTATAPMRDGASYDPASNTWTSIDTIGAPSSRSSHSAVWAGNQMIVWGGAGAGGGDLSTGGRYDPFVDRWTPTSITDAPQARSQLAAVWDGTAMLVWGGRVNGTNTAFGSGGAYEPLTDTWSQIPALNAPSARFGHSAVWTGSLMIIWGGWGGMYQRTGARFDPTTGAWTPTAIGRAPSPRPAHSGIWTGSMMVIWGGTSDPLGGRYDPATDDWRPMSLTNAPAPRSFHSTIWTGRHMIVWGGDTNTGSLPTTGGSYDPISDVWSPTSTIDTPSGRKWHTAVWTGTEMIVWGGADPNQAALVSGGRYRPDTDAWSPVSTDGAPSARTDFTAVWTGHWMVVWGGSDGRRYDPGTDTWEPVSPLGAPEPRNRHTAVWTGSVMLVWGGQGNGGWIAGNGFRYDPGLDSWTPMSTTGAPLARYLHTAVWTGHVMIVWGGFSGTDWIQSGGRYDPVTDTWMPTSLISAPSPRTGHSAVWTGSQMLVWGGGRYIMTDTGGRYTLGMSEDDDGDGYSECAGDCADADPAVRPGVAEICDGIDNNCVDGIDEGFDVDGDGFASCLGDCNDQNAGIRPGAPEICDGVDNNCVGGVDEGADLDGDTFDAVCGGDCDDADSWTHPGAPEVNDGRDNQCAGEDGDGIVDEISGPVWFSNPAPPDQFCWQPQGAAGTYTVARAQDAAFTMGCELLATGASGCVGDPALPSSGSAYYYLVRPASPRAGSWGQDSEGRERRHVCEVHDYTFSFIDGTASDDIADLSLRDFFASVITVPSSHIFFEVTGSPTGGAWCSERADFYRDNYLSLAASGGIVSSGSWNRWSRAGSGPWSAPSATGFTNYFGASCYEAWSWCGEYGLGDLLLDVRPMLQGVCEITDDHAGCTVNGTWRLTIHIADVRQTACGF